MIFFKGQEVNPLMLRKGDYFFVNEVVFQVDVPTTNAGNDGNCSVIQGKHHYPYPEAKFVFDKRTPAFRAYSLEGLLS